MGEVESGIYVYGIIAGDLPPLCGPGIDGVHPPYAIAWQTVRAVVSQVPLEEFGETPLHEKLQDLRWLAAKVREHEAMVERVMRQETVLPCQFCTIYRSEGRVCDMLARHYHQCRDALRFLHHKEEWGVKGYIDEEILRHRLMQTDEELRGIARVLVGKSPGSAYLTQKTLERRLAEQCDRTLARLHLQLTCALRTYAVQSEALSPLTLRLSPPETRLFLSAAYLVAKAQVGSFAASVAALTGQFAHAGVRLVLSGPWPPYHFSPKLEREGS